MHSNLNYTVFNITPVNYSPSCLFLPSLPIQMPLFYFEASELCPYPKMPETIDFSSFLSSANMQPGVLDSNLLNFSDQQQPSEEKMT